MYYMAHVGQILQSWMESAGISQNELARRTGVNQPTIARIFSGQSKDPRVDNLERLCRPFGKTVTDLYEAAKKNKFDPANIEHSAETLELLSKFNNLTPAQRLAVLAVMESMN